MKALSIADLRKVYSNNVTALKGISFDVEEGDFFGILGPNGAGKSTTIGIIAGLVNKTGGTVRIFDLDIDTETNRAKTSVGLVPQEFNFNIFEKVIDIVVNQGGYYGIPRRKALKRAEYLLDRLRILEKRNSRSQTLSGGMKRKLMIARALVHEPRLLILDEPTAGVDVETRREMWEFMRELNDGGTTIILTTHYLEEAERLCRNAAIIDKGEIIENTAVSELLLKLDRETLILDLKEAVETVPPLEGYDMSLQDARTIKVELPRNRNLNDVIIHLNRHGIEVLSMRNSAGRLEELFLHLTGKR